MKNETWFEFMERARENGLSPQEQHEIDRDDLKKEHVIEENMPYKDFYDEIRISILQYNNLRKHFKKMVNNVLGENYYNMGADVYESDRLCCEDITRKAKRGFFTRFI